MKPRTLGSMTVSRVLRTILGVVGLVLRQNSDGTNFLWLSETPWVSSAFSRAAALQVPLRLDGAQTDEA